jgi:hypothetical protein
VWILTPLLVVKNQKTEHCPASLKMEQDMSLKLITKTLTSPVKNGHYLFEI